MRDHNKQTPLPELAHFAGGGVGVVGGVVGCGLVVGTAGGVLDGAVGAEAGELAGMESSTDPPPPAALDDMSERTSDVAMKIPADHAVSRESSVAAPRAPNAVCEPPPPNAPARSARFPV
jgi:hypothetical protein